MSKRAFDKTTKGLREALSIARGDAKPAKLHIPPEIDVRYIRNKLRLSQDDFCGSVRFYAQSDHGLGAGPISTARRGASLFDAYRS